MERIWFKPGIKLVCAILSLPIASESANSGAEEIDNVADKVVPDNLEQKTPYKFLMVGYDQSGTSTIFKQFHVPDTRRIFVDVGLGFHVEFTWPEALNYISAREEKLTRQIEEYTSLIASIKAQIKTVCEGIRELLQIPAE